MLKTRNQKIGSLFELLYNEIKEENNDIILAEKIAKVEIDKHRFIELVKDMEISLKISLEYIKKSEIIPDTVYDGYFSYNRMTLF